MLYLIGFIVVFLFLCGLISQLKDEASTSFGKALVLIGGIVVLGIFFASCA